MWILKGTFLGLTIFAVGVTTFLVAFFRSLGPLLAGPGQHYSIDIRTIFHVTTQNIWFWAAAVACLVIGWAIVASWPGRFSPLFWVMLAVADVVPATLLGVFVMLALSLLRRATK
jgi:hypothetical protein